jgi:hypothetical protein
MKTGGAESSKFRRFSSDGDVPQMVSEWSEALVARSQG